jgi:predicted phospho-2-dehydro-3-deoxyheptonate aldolase
MVNGKTVRLSRLLKKGRMLCIPMDHGVSIGPSKGLDTILDTITQVTRGGASAILAHKGILKAIRGPPNIAMIMHASASTTIGPAPNRKIEVASVTEAIRLGADAVSVHVNVGSKEEPEMLRDLGRMARRCDEWEVPLVAMMYPRGENIKNPEDPKILAHAARIGAELGADIVKTPYSGDSETFRDVVKGCPVPLVIAGGPKADNDREVLETAAGAIKAGALGVTFGRNVFGHPRPDKIVSALAAVVYEGKSVDDALTLLSS